MTDIYTNHSIVEFVELIDAKFEEYVGTIDRIDIKWGVWSRDMNVEVKRRMDMDTPNNEQVRLGLLFSYWIAISHLLDLLHNKKRGVLENLFLTKKVRNKTDEALLLRKHIMEL